MYMLVKYDGFVFRIARQLNYKRTLTSSTTARIDLAGFPYEAFEQGGNIYKSLLISKFKLEFRESDVLPGKNRSQTRQISQSYIPGERVILTPHSTGRRFRYTHGDLGFSLKLFQIAAEA